jgi:hypothetical protein
MQRGRPKSALKLTDEQREQLKHWTRRRTTGRALARRAEIILLSAEEAHRRDNRPAFADDKSSSSSVATAISSTRCGWSAGRTAGDTRPLRGGQRQILGSSDMMQELG